MASPTWTAWPSARAPAASTPRGSSGTSRGGAGSCTWPSARTRSARWTAFSSPTPSSPASSTRRHHASALGCSSPRTSRAPSTISKLASRRCWSPHGAALVDEAPTRIGGRLQLAADLEGSIHRFDASGEAMLAAARFRGAAAANAALRFAATGVRTDGFHIETHAAVDSLGFGRRLLTTAALDARYEAQGTGELRADASAAGDQSFSAAAAFRRIAGGFEADLHQLGFSARGTTWALDSTVALRLDEQGLAVAGLQLNQQGASGHIAVDGRLPWAPPAGA